jgi:hypothetical protein
VLVLTNYVVDLTIPYYTTIILKISPLHFGASKSTSIDVKRDVFPGSALKVRIRKPRECVLITYPIQYLTLK